MNRRFTLLTLIIALVLSGCVLEEGILALYTDEDGKIHACPSVAGDWEEELSAEQYQYIQYYESETDEGVEPDLLTCSREDCHSETDCCGLDREQAKIYYHSFRLGVCPKKMTCKTEEGNTDIFYCSKPQAICTDEQEECGGACVNLRSDMNHCGQCFIKCSPDVQDNSVATVCNQGRCEATKCESGYHLVNGQCVGDDDTMCGGKNCNDLEGWESGVCSSLGVCVVEKCKQEYHRYDDGTSVICELDSNEHCKEHDIHCEAKEGERYVICNEDKKCEVTKCENGYHWNRTNSGCTKDSIEECGWFNNNCNALSGWIKDDPTNECRDGYNCYTEHCAENFHRYNKEVYGINVPCMMDRNDACGESEEDCSSKGMMCTKGVCTEGCDVGLHQCETGCVDINTNSYNCGKCGESCEVSNAVSFKCVDGQCKIESCLDHFHPYGTICEEDSDENCGEHGNSCSSLSTGSGSQYSCINCTCQISTCEAGYYYHSGSHTCKPNDNSNCGAEGNVCKMTGASNVQCDIKTGKCYASSCGNGYHLHGTECEADSNVNCGAHGQACNTSTILNSSEVNCNSEGQCELIRCDKEFHKNGNFCERNDDNNCGRAGNRCTPKNHLVYSCNVDTGTCETNNKCESGYADCNGNKNSDGCEVNLSEFYLSSCNDCASGYRACGNYYQNNNILLCIKYNDLIAWQYCSVHCNNDGSINDKPYTPSRCSPGQTCVLNQSNNVLSCKWQ